MFLIAIVSHIPYTREWKSSAVSGSKKTLAPRSNMFRNTRTSVSQFIDPKASHSLKNYVIQFCKSHSTSVLSESTCAHLQINI